MSTDVTMQELEFETAELLPARETLNCYSRHSGSSFTNVVGNTSQNQSGIGNVAVSAFNGEGNSLTIL
jgi:hypothetical protein